MELLEPSDVPIAKKLDGLDISFPEKTPSSHFERSEDVAEDDTVRHCLSLICDVLTFDIAEVWIKKAEELQCYKVFSTASAFLNGLSVVGEVSYYHRLSPTLCERAAATLGEPLWFTSLSEGSPLHPELPLCTAVVTHEQVSTCKNMDFFVICYSTKRLQSDHPISTFLRHIVKACAITACRKIFPTKNEEHQDVIKEMTNINGVNVLVHKERDLGMDVSWQELTDVHFLANGGFCTIYKAKFKHIPVVIKKVKDNDAEIDRVAAGGDLENETHLLMKLKHENILDIYGAGTVPERFIILEKLDGGSIHQMRGGGTDEVFKRRKAFSHLEVLEYARQFAAALKYLHEDAIPGFITLHRDLKPGNVGFKMKPDGSLILKLMDFGLAKSIPRGENEHQVYEMSGETGSVRYMAPEVHRSAPYNEKADIYSYAMVVWEMVTLRKPFDGMDASEFADRVIRGRQRPPINKKWDEGFSQLLALAWDHDPRQRPSAAVLMERLDALIAVEKLHQQNNLRNDSPRLLSSKSRRNSHRPASARAVSPLESKSLSPVATTKKKGWFF